MLDNLNQDDFIDWGTYRKVSDKPLVLENVLGW